jgi:hypothetical protein
VTTTLHPARADARNADADLDHRGSSGRGTEVALPSLEDRAAERRSRAELLAASADGDRQQLEDLRSDYLRRLHRTSDDFEATEGLRTVELALSMTPRPEGLWAWQRRERDRKPRWWNRRKRPTT